MLLEWIKRIGSVLKGVGCAGIARVYLCFVLACFVDVRVSVLLLGGCGSLCMWVFL